MQALQSLTGDFADKNQTNRIILIEIRRPIKT